MSSIRLTPRARAGLARLLSEVRARFGLAVAERVLQRFEQAFERIAEQPGIGHRREDLSTDARLRFWSVGPTLIAYVVVDEEVRVVFVERGELDWPRLLGRLTPEP